MKKIEAIIRHFKLEEVKSALNAQGVNMAIVELRSRLKDLILRYGLLKTLDRDHFYPSVVTALEAIATEDRVVGSDRAASPTDGDD